jgi:glyoxylase-like metal-dependent hydrolase (beta-lactamase superfamily II)
MLARVPPPRQAVLLLGQLEILGVVDGDTALTKGVSVVSTPGHTPGHSGLLVSSGGEQALLLGDAFHHPAQFTELAWATRYDDDLEMAATTRRRLAEWAERNRIVVAASHLPAPGFGRIILNHDGLRWDQI